VRRALAPVARDVDSAVCAKKLRVVVRWPTCVAQCPVVRGRVRSATASALSDFLDTQIRRSSMILFFSLARHLSGSRWYLAEIEKEIGLQVCTGRRKNSSRGAGSDFVLNTRVALFAVAIGTLLAPAMLARETGLGEFRALQESLQYLPPNIRFYELDRLGVTPGSPSPSLSESTGLRLVGKWGAGPSVKVTGRDSLVFLSRGSQVVVINYADTANPQVLSYIEVNGLVSRSVLAGNRLYVGSTGSDPKYIDAYDVADPTSPQKLGSVQTRLLDIDAVDTLVYTVAKDSFRVFNFADPANPRQIGACRDSGYTLSVCNGYAYVADRWGLYVVDVRDPTSPHHEASWGTAIISVKARGNICCATTDNQSNPGVLKFTILDVRTPSSPTPLGSLDSCGACDVFLDGQLTFLSGYHIFNEFRILDISDSTNPRHVGTAATPDQNFGVWENSMTNLAYVADDFGGLIVIDISNLNAPAARDTLLKAGLSHEVLVQGGYAYVASEGVGLKVLDVSDPRFPREVGSVDSTRTVGTNTVAVRDSFAFIGWVTHPLLRVVDVSDPCDPRKVAPCDLFNPAEAMVWRDSFLYVAEIARLQVVDVARPRQPSLVGTCLVGDLHQAGLSLQNDLAYVAGPYDGIYVVDVSDPRNPSPVKVLTGVSAWGCCVRDSLLFVSDFDDSLHIWSVVNLFNVYELGAVHVSSAGYDVKVLGDYAFVGAKGLGLVDISDSRNPGLLAYYSTPDFVRRVTCDSPYIYAACYSGGVCIFDTASTAVSERSQVLVSRDEARLLSSVTTGHATIELSVAGRKEVSLQVFDVAGKSIGGVDILAIGSGTTRHDLKLIGMAAGVYIVRASVGNRVYQLRVTKLRQRR
jgi:hypothetical protein